MSTASDTDVSKQMYAPAIESLSGEGLQGLQWRKLQRQLERLYHTNPYYSRRLKQHGVQPDEITSLQAFRERIPLCGKRDLLADQEEHPPFGSRLGVSQDRVVQIFLTSGTSGVGQEVYGHTWRDALAGGTGLIEAPFYWAGWRPGDRIYSMTPVATLAFGLCAMEAFRLAGYQPIQAFLQDSPTKLAFMRRFPPHGMLLTPAHLARLTTVCKEQGTDPRDAYPGLQSIVIAGQSWPLELVQGAEETWGARVFDLYGSTQGNGSIAANCEYGAVREGQRMAMHVLEHRNLLEILNPDTWEPVEPGEEGMGVITNLGVEGSPLLRFRTDDKIRYLGVGHCPCGRATALVEAGTLSRYDDMMKVRGMNVWPQAVDDVMFGHEVIDEYVGRVYVDEGDLEQIEIRYALTSGANADERARLKDRLVRELKERINVTCRLEEVPRSELPVFDFKAVRWTDTRQADLQKKVW